MGCCLWAKEAGSWLGLMRIHNPGDAVYARPSNIPLPWVTGFKQDAVIHNSYLAWVDFNKLQADKYVQLLGDTVKIKGTVIILSPLSLTHRTLILCLVPLGIVYVIHKVMMGILEQCKSLMSIEIYLWFERAVELTAAITSAASAALTLLALHILLNHAPGIYYIPTRNSVSSI